MPDIACPHPGTFARPARQAGFTLIELIAVIIILGILAAVITPKYFEMTTKAQDAAYKSALSEAGSRVYMAYAQYIAETRLKPTDLNNLANGTLLGGSNLSAINIGGYDVAYTLSGQTVTMTLNTPGQSDSLTTGTAPWPQ